MIKTKYNAKISIDDKEFNVIVSEPSLAQRKELEMRAEGQKAKLDELSAINLQREQISLEIANKERVLSINTELLSTLNAEQKAELIDHNKHTISTAAHPSPLSATHGFFGCKHFSKTNEILENSGQTKINWQIENITRTFF